MYDEKCRSTDRSTHAEPSHTKYLDESRVLNVLSRLRPVRTVFENQSDLATQSLFQITLDASRIDEIYLLK